MTIGFFATRKGFLKVMGALIRAAMLRGHRVVLLWDPDERKLGEAVTEPDLRNWPGARVVMYRRGHSLLPLLRAEAVDVLVAPSLYLLLRAMGLEAEIAPMRQAGMRFYSVDYVFDTVTSDPEGYRALDTTFYMSDFQRRLHWRVFTDHFARLSQVVDVEGRSAVCGSTMLDQLALVDRASVRKKYGLAPEQRVVLFMSPKMAVPDPWRRLVWGGGWWGWRAAKAYAGGHADLVPEIWKGNGYLVLAESVRRFCQRQGAVFVVKSRAKNADPRFLRRLADVFVEKDEDVLPYTSIELMAVADFCIHFQSGAVLEAAFAGVPSLSVKVPQSHLEEYPGFQETFGGEPGSLQNFPGIVWATDHERAPGALERATLDDFKIVPEARRRYVEKFLGFDDTGSSERVLDVIERAG